VKETDESIGQGMASVTWDCSRGQAIESERASGLLKKREAMGAHGYR